MSKQFLYTVIVLLVCMVATVKWHHNTDNFEHEFQIDSDIYVMNLLGQKLEDKDKYIKFLEGMVAHLAQQVETPSFMLPEPESE